MTNGLNDTGPTIELAKPADPIVWDGSDAMIAEVAAALPSPWECHKAFLARGTDSAQVSDSARRSRKGAEVDIEEGS